MECFHVLTMSQSNKTISKGIVLPFGLFQKESHNLVKQP